MEKIKPDFTFSSINRSMKKLWNMDMKSSHVVNMLN